MYRIATTRRGLMAGAAGLAAFAGAGPKLARAAAAPPLPASPVSLNVIDVAGQLQLVQAAIQTFANENPKLIAKVNFSQAPAPELPGKIKAQQSAGQVDIDLVLTGTDALAAGVAQNLWLPLASDYASSLPDLQKIYLPGAWKMQGLAEGQGVCVVFCPAGPLLQYMPDAVKKAPTTTGELLDYTKQNPKRFLYARPANSGPGRTWLQGLPYLLGDKDPKDPKDGWDKTWSYLAALGKNIEYYPTGTGAVMKELGEGSRDMTVTMTGWDLNPRILGVVPKESEISVFKGFRWVTDAQYWCVPKGLSNDKLAVLLAMTNYMLTKPAQATTFDKGYFYPGPAVAGVTLDMAPKAEQDLINAYNRPIYAKLIADVPTETPLPADRLVYAFQRWDQQIGAKAGQ